MLVLGAEHVSTIMGRQERLLGRILSAPDAKPASLASHSRRVVSEGAL
jgi:hypothetical protein